MKQNTLRRIPLMAIIMSESLGPYNKNWDSSWKRQYLNVLRANASEFVPRKKYIQIARESDDQVFAKLEVVHPKFPTPSSPWTFSNNFWCCDPTIEHPVVKLLAEDNFLPDAKNTIKRSMDVLTGNRFYYADELTFEIPNKSTSHDAFWEDMWKQSPAYNGWKSDPNSVLLATISIEVYLTADLVNKLKQTASSYKEGSEPISIVVQVQGFEHRIHIDDVGKAVQYRTNYTLK